MALAPPAPKCAKCQSALAETGTFVLQVADAQDPSKAFKVTVRTCTKDSCGHVELFKA